MPITEESSGQFRGLQGLWLEINGEFKRIVEGHLETPAGTLGKVFEDMGAPSGTYVSMIHNPERNTFLVLDSQHQIIRAFDDSTLDWIESQDIVRNSANWGTNRDAFALGYGVEVTYRDSRGERQPTTTFGVATRFAGSTTIDRIYMLHAQNAGRERYGERDHIANTTQTLIAFADPTLNFGGGQAHLLETFGGRIFVRNRNSVSPFNTQPLQLTNQDAVDMTYYELGSSLDPVIFVLDRQTRYAYAYGTVAAFGRPTLNEDLSGTASDPVAIASKPNDQANLYVFDGTRVKRHS